MRMRHDLHLVDYLSDPAREGHISYNLYQRNSGSTNERERIRMKRFISRAVKHCLTARQQQCLLMYYVDGKKMKDIAVELNLSASTVSRHISTAIRKIKKLKVLM